MPWRTTGVEEQRMQFVIRATSGAERLSALCREFGISRPTGYEWRQAIRTVADADADPRTQSATSPQSDAHRSRAGAARGGVAKADGMGRQEAARAAGGRRDSAAGANDSPDSGAEWFGERTGPWASARAI